LLVLLQASTLSCAFSSSPAIAAATSHGIRRACTASANPSTRRPHQHHAAAATTTSSRGNSNIAPFGETIRDRRRRLDP